MSRMSHWTYRVAKRTIDGEDVYDIREVYYDRGGDQVAWSAEPDHPQGETLADLITTLERMLDATTGTILDLDALEAEAERRRAPEATKTPAPTGDTQTP